MLGWTPTFWQSLAEGWLDLPFFETDDKQMLNHLPELTFAEVRFHVIDDASFDNRFLMVGRINKMLERRIHGVRAVQVRTQHNVTKIATNGTAFQAFEHGVFLSAADAMFTGGAPFFPGSWNFLFAHVCILQKW